MRTVVLWSALVFLVAMSAPALPARAQDLSSTNYQVLAPVIVSGGGYSNSSSFSVLGVISEFTHDIASSLSFGSNPGFAAFPFVSTPVVSATGGNASASLSWTAATGVLGYSVSSYSIGQSGVSGGPYSFTSVGNVLSSSVSGLTNGSTYYFIIRAHDQSSLVIATSSQVSATPAAPAPPPPAGGGGGGGGGGGIVSPQTIVNFSGRAYPKSSVTFLKDAQVAVTTIAGTDAQFSASLTNLTGGNYIFAVYAEDKDGNRSSLLTFPVAVTTGATTNVSGIFLAPTLSSDKSEVKKGDTVTLFGQSVPKSDIIISVNSAEEFFGRTITDKDGVYLYNFDSTVLEYGSHTAKSKSSIGNELISSFSATASFKVGTKNIIATKTTKCSIIGDLNDDCKVNLTDFSIMAYWYKRTLSGNGFRADLNRDGKVNLTDFSILAAHWTG